ncbi:MAG TPA: hypothetical protein VIJ14_07685, partial [Rhabdochlamydiaceae bacterium]
PQLICIEGTKAEVELKSPDEHDVLIVSVLVPENNATEAKASIYMTEFKKVVISKDENIKIAGENIKIGTKRKFRTWADIREKIAQEAEKGVPKASAASQDRS